MPPEPGNESDARFRALRELGLTEYQAKAYAALLRLGKGTAAQVANVTDVPRNKLYPAMQQLNALGLVETSLGEAQVFRPLALDRFLDERLRALRAQAELLGEGRAALLELFRAPGGEADAAPAGYRLYHGRANMLDQLRGALREARRDVVLLGSAGAASQLLASGAAEAVRERLDEGARVRAVFPPGDVVLLRELEHAWGPGVLRVHPGLVPGALLCACDGASALVAQVQPDDAALARGNDITLVTASPVVARVVEHYAQPLWAGAEPLAARSGAPQAPWRSPP